MSLTRDLNTPPTPAALEDYQRSITARSGRLTKTHVGRQRVRRSPRPTAPSQRFIVAGLRKRRFQDDGIVGEESETGQPSPSNATTRAARNWVIDPIDGTNNFIAGPRGVHLRVRWLLRRGSAGARRGVRRDDPRPDLYRAARGQGRGWGRGGSDADARRPAVGVDGHGHLQQPA